MRPHNKKLVLAVLVGILVGVARARAIHGQQEKTPPGYVISEADAITDVPMVQKYGQGVPETLAPFNHHFIVRGGKPQSLDGGEAPKSVVVIVFDSVEKAREWYESPAYLAIKPLRESATKRRMFIVEGVTPWRRDRTAGRKGSDEATFEELRPCAGCVHAARRRNGSL